MKAAETKSTEAGAKTNTPFFSKEGGAGFFSKPSGDKFFNKGSSQNPFIQKKLTVGQPNDKYEQEADAMADKVVQRLNENSQEPSRHNGNTIQAKPIAPLAAITPFVQTKCASCEQEEKLQKKEEVEEKDLQKNKLKRKPIFESNAEPPPDEEKNIQRKCAECEKEEKLQKKSDAVSGQTAPSNVESSLNSSKGSGNPLPASTRNQMENSFGADFSNVRIHNDTFATEMNKDLNAQAFTHGNDIYFNSGKFDTNSNSGKHLLAHELTHTIQQDATKERLIQTAPSASPPTSNIIYIDVNILDQINRGNVDVASQLRLFQNSGFVLKINPYTYQEAIKPPSEQPELGQALQLMIKEMNIQIGPDPSQETRIDTAMLHKGNIDFKNYKDTQIIVSAKLENAQIWSMDRRFRNGSKEIENVYKVTVNPASYDIEKVDDSKPDYRVGRILLNLPPVQIATTANTSQAKPDVSKANNILEGLDEVYSRYTTLNRIDEVASLYGTFVSPTAKFAELSALKKEIEANLTEYIRLSVYNRPNNAQRLSQLKQSLIQKNSLEDIITPAYMKDVEELYRTGPFIVTFNTEVEKAKETGRLSDVGIEALWELDPPTARQFIQNSGLSKGQQAEILNNMPGQPIPLRSRFAAGFLLAIQLIEIAAPFIQMKQQEAASEDVGKSLNDILWWLDKGVSPEIQGLNHRWIRSNLWSNKPDDIFAWYRSGDLDYLALTSIPDTDSTWTNFTIWASLNIKNHRDWEYFILNSNSVKEDGVDANNKLIFKYRTGKIVGTTFAHEVEEQWNNNPRFSMILNATWDVVYTNTTKQIQDIGTKGKPFTSEYQTSGYHSSEIFKGLPQATGKKRFKKNLSERVLYTVVGRRKFTDFPDDSIFFTFPSDIVKGYEGASVPDGYIVVGGADYFTYANIYSYKGRYYQPIREVILAKIEDLEEAK
ncbi:MAG TPA: DUF4157 domain-containing protein [Puia sp.]|nr:DUF4157 domain-containing protein [Puia sp.]